MRAEGERLSVKEKGSGGELGSDLDLDPDPDLQHCPKRPIAWCIWQIDNCES